jgi:hypothetical protein
MNRGGAPHLASCILLLQPALTNSTRNLNLDRVRWSTKMRGWPGTCGGQHIFVLIFLVTFFIKEKSDKKI